MIILVSCWGDATVGKDGGGDVSNGNQLHQTKIVFYFQLFLIKKTNL